MPVPASLPELPPTVPDARTLPAVPEPARTPAPRRRIVLLLPGQGAQRERMGVGLYGNEPVFTTHMDAFFAALDAAAVRGPDGTEGSGTVDGSRLRDAWWAAAPAPVLADALIAQPLLFAVGYALGRTVASWGTPPHTHLGHSVGELAGACLAGVFAPADGAALMAARGEALRGSGTGGMLAVAAAPRELAGHLTGELGLAAVNGPRQTVLSGPAAQLAAVAERLRADGRTVRALRSSHAFHGPLLRPAAERFAAALAGVRLHPSAARVYSCRTARPVTRQQAVRPEFWAGGLVDPVLYWPALEALLEREGRTPGLLLLDASPDRSLSAPARRHPAVRDGASVVVPLLPATGHGTARDLEALAEARDAVGRLAEPPRRGPRTQAVVSRSFT
ncbi:acyltransferase domain-containing protein [Streptomyces nodosus]|uniref:acyltransferase domain-containing protein n=2 Tax=Streptomyces TaxID=1883 RepID=UPI0036ED6F68